MLRAMVVVALLVGAGGVHAEEDDPQLAAALLKCPGAASFVSADKLRQQQRHQALRDVVPSEPALRAQLLEMQRVDQDARQHEWSPAMIARMQEVDAANLPKIKQVVIDHGGLPGARQVGGDGVSAAWLLVQHADADVAFQQHVLEGLMPQVDSGEVSAHDFALLTDRVLVNTGKPQRYGSQLEAVSGKWQSKPMEAPEQVDQRRAAIGQMPLADYICMATQMIPPPLADALR